MGKFTKASFKKYVKGDDLLVAVTKEIIAGSVKHYKKVFKPLDDMDWTYLLSPKKNKIEAYDDGVHVGYSLENEIVNLIIAKDGIKR